MASYMMKTLAKTEKDPAAIAKAKARNHVPWCEDYERCISGMLYDAMCKPMIDSRFRAKRITHRYNTWFPEEVDADALTAGREKMVRDLFGEVGKEPWIEAPMFVDYGCNVSVGDRFYANYNMTILDCGLVTIGDRVMFGPNVHIYAGTHDIEVEPRQHGLEYGKEVIIEDDAWIGGNVVIMPGVTVGRGTTVGAGAVVTKSIPPFSVAVGNPARVVKKLEAVGPPKEKE